MALRMIRLWWLRGWSSRSWPRELFSGWPRELFIGNCSFDVDDFEDGSGDGFEDGPADGFEDQQVDAYGFEDGTADADGFEDGSEGWQKMLVKAGYNKQQQQ